MRTFLREGNVFSRVYLSTGKKSGSIVSQIGTIHTGPSDPVPIALGHRVHPACQIPELRCIVTSIGMQVVGLRLEGFLVNFNLRQTSLLSSLKTH